MIINTNDFLDAIVSNSFIPCIHFPILSLEIISGNMTAILSDYLPQFSFAANILSSLSTQRSNFYERDVSKFNQKKLYT